VCAHVKDSKKFLACWCPVPLGYYEWLNARNTPVLCLSCHAEFGHCRSNHMVVSRGIPENFWGAFPHSLRMRGVSGHTSSPQVLPRQIWSFSVEWLVRNYGDPPEKFDPSHPAFQGHSSHWNQHRSIGHLWLSINIPWKLWAYLLPFPS